MRLGAANNVAVLAFVARHIKSRSSGGTATVPCRHHGRGCNAITTLRHTPQLTGASANTGTTATRARSPSVSSNHVLGAFKAGGTRRARWRQRNAVRARARPYRSVNAGCRCVCNPRAIPASQATIHVPATTNHRTTSNYTSNRDGAVERHSVTRAGRHRRSHCQEAKKIK